MRNQFFKKLWHFTGSFTENCQNESASASLLSLIHMITSSSYDPHSENKSTENTHIPLLSLSQLIHFNTICQRGNSGNSSHISAHETPLSTYIVFLLHSQMRSRLLMDKFYDLGLFISYDWMLFLSTQLGNSIFTQFESDGAVCPT